MLSVSACFYVLKENHLMSSSVPQRKGFRVTLKFSDTVKKVDINPYVKVPDAVVQKLLRAAGKERGPLPVKGTVQGQPFKATVVLFRGVWRLYLNTAMRRAAGVDVGDKAIVALIFDNEPRSVPMPGALSAALSENQAAGEAFRKLPPSHQREILNYLNSLKRSESLKRNVERTVRILLARGQTS